MKFPTKEQARANVRHSFGALKRPWVVIVLLLFWAAVLALTWGQTDNSLPLVAGMFFTTGFMRRVGPPKPKPKQ